VLRSGDPTVAHLGRPTPERALQLESICYGLLQGSAEHEAWLAARVAVEHRRPREGSASSGAIRCYTVVLEREQARNAIDRPMRDQLFEAFDLAALDPQIHAIKMRAVGPAFSIGGDLEEFGTTRDPRRRT